VSFYGVVDARDEEVVGFFLDHEQAETFLEEVRGDEPALADLLRIELVEFEVAQPAAAR
jgi:hypothetical protein